MNIIKRYDYDINDQLDSNYNGFLMNVENATLHNYLYN